MSLSVFDLFRIGIGPSSSHTVGPMRAAKMFVSDLNLNGVLGEVDGLHIELYGSLGATGRGHGSIGALIVGLEGGEPATVDPGLPAVRADAIAQGGHLMLADRGPITFDLARDLILDGRRTIGHHSNGMTFEARDRDGRLLLRRLYFSVGGGFVTDPHAPDPTIRCAEPPIPFHSAQELLAACDEHGLAISDVVRANETVAQTPSELDAGLLQLAAVMGDCIATGMEATGELPGGLHVRRRASGIRAELEHEQAANDPLLAMEWVALWALAVSEQNASGGRVVTAPTNGAAGIIPAVLHFYRTFVPGSDDEGVKRFLLTAAAIGFLFKENASISGAEVGCQGEVGSACSMAAGALAEVLGGTPRQVENAAEIGIEHNLGLTCDPVGGLVQIPCIERNAVAAIKAITAARMAIRGDGTHHVSLDRAIMTMRDTGADMADKYKETGRGGLALNVVEC